MKKTITFATIAILFIVVPLSHAFPNAKGITGKAVLDTSTMKSNKEDFVVWNPNTTIEHPPYSAQYNKISAISNVLDSVERRLENILTQYDGETPAPKGMTGKLRAITRQLMVQEKKLTTVMDNLTGMEINKTNKLEKEIESLGNFAVRIAGLSQAWLQMTRNPDLIFDPDILDSLGELESAAENILHNVHVYFDVLWDKVIPLRFVQVLNCYPFLQSCQPHIDWDSLDASVDSLNDALHGIGLHFWIKSVESYYMYHFAHEQFPTGSMLDWADAKYEIEQVFPITDLDNWPSDRRTNEWIGYMSTIFSDPNELLVWIFGQQSLVSREMGHHSASAFPNGGRTVIMSAQNINDPNRPPAQPALSPNHLTHELGHFFGVRHTWNGPTGTNPYTLQPVAWPDLWDLIFCPGELGFPIWFSSRQAAENANCSFENIEKHDPINCHVDNRYGADDSDMYCTVPVPGGTNYFSGYPLLKGLSFPTGMPEDPPIDAYDDTYSFAYGLNVMGYYGRYNAHLYTPGRFSASQLELIKGHTLYDVPIVDAAGFYQPFENLWSQRSQLGN